VNNISTEDVSVDDGSLTLSTGSQRKVPLVVKIQNKKKKPLVSFSSIVSRSSRNDVVETTLATESLQPRCYGTSSSSSVVKIGGKIIFDNTCHT
jgi:hypothetical protein